MGLKTIALLLASLAVFQETSGHGMMLDPPNRSSLWRFDKTAPINWDDDQNYCGSFGIQWNSYNGKCGVCGDSYGDPHPQDNENTGKYGTGRVVKTYTSGSVIDVNIKLTANHLGYFKYSVCVLEDPTKPESGEECFKDLKLEDGSDSFKIKSGVSKVVNRVKLPEGLKCARCVLRWHYNGGVNWGKCDDGSYASGCGPQEQFRSCADIAIV